MSLCIDSRVLAKNVGLTMVFGAMLAASALALDPKTEGEVKPVQAASPAAAPAPPETPPSPTPEQKVAPGPKAEEETAKEPADPIPLDRQGVVTMALKDAPAITCLEQIVLNGNYDLVAPPISRTVTAFLSGVSIREALDAITFTAHLQYSVKGRIILIYRSNDAPPKFARPSSKD